MYKVIKLVTGEYVLGRFTKRFSDGSIEVENPYCLVAREDGAFMMFPYCFYTNDERITFNLQAIVMVCDANERIVKIFTDYTTNQSDELSAKINSFQFSELRH